MKALAAEADRVSLGAQMARDAESELRSKRDALRTRVLILEAALACIDREAEISRDRPDASFTAVQRIGAIVRQVLPR
jgi:hypothetical protein